MGVVARGEGRFLGRRVLMSSALRCTGQVIEGNYERMSGVCPWWDAVKRAGSRSECAAGGARIDWWPASQVAGFPAPIAAEPARCHRTSVSGRMVVIALTIDGNHRYNWR